MAEGDNETGLAGAENETGANGAGGTSHQSADDATKGLGGDDATKGLGGEDDWFSGVESEDLKKAVSGFKTREEAAKALGIEQPAGAPKEYEDFELPEGVQIDESQKERMSTFKELAREMGLSQENAQKLVTMQAEALKAQGEAQAQNRVDLLNDAKKDSEIGGPKFAAAVESGNRALNEFGTPELKQIMKDTGWGNHVEMIRFMSKVGDLVKDDTVTTGPGGRGSPGTRDQRIAGMFPKSAPQGA